MRFRAPTPDDSAAVLAVISARDVVDLGTPDYTLEDLEQEWRLPGFELSHDARVVEGDDGQIVGYAVVRGPGTLAAVAPDHEGRGTGARLLAWAEGRECELGRPRHRQWIGGDNARAAALLRRAGYEYVRSYWRMARKLAEEPAPEPPPGVALRRLDVERDAEEIHALYAVSFSANPDYHPQSFEEFTAEHLRAHDLDAALGAVAEDGGRIVGFALARNWADRQEGFIDLLAVAPDHQHQGLGTALLRTTFSRFAAAGLREAQLGVAGDNPRALDLYERAGMKAKFRSDTYERPVDPELS